MTNQPIIELKDIEIAFGTKKVLDGFNLLVRAGVKLSVVGESSSGKSTLLKIIVGLITQSRGSVKIFGRDLAGLSNSEMNRIRQRMSMQFQSGALFDSMSIIENLKLARRESAHNPAAVKAAKDSDPPLELLVSVGLGSAADRYPFELSGGMRKRAALARALSTEPEIAIFDEPTAGLDPVTSRRIINLIKGSSARSGAVMILATTDVQVARHFSPNMVIMHQGRVRASGNIKKLQASEDEFVQKLLSRQAGHT